MYQRRLVLLEVGNTFSLFEPLPKLYGRRSLPVSEVSYSVYFGDYELLHATRGQPLFEQVPISSPMAQLPVVTRTKTAMLETVPPRY